MDPIKIMKLTLALTKLDGVITTDDLPAGVKPLLDALKEKLEKQKTIVSGLEEVIGIIEKEVLEIEEADPGKDLKNIDGIIEWFQSLSSSKRIGYLGAMSGSARQRSSDDIQCEYVFYDINQVFNAYLKAEAAAKLWARQHIQSEKEAMSLDGIIAFAPHTTSLNDDILITVFAEMDGFVYKISSLDLVKTYTAHVDS